MVLKKKQSINDSHTLHFSQMSNGMNSLFLEERVKHNLKPQENIWFIFFFSFCLCPSCCLTIFQCNGGHQHKIMWALWRSLETCTAQLESWVYAHTEVGREKERKNERESKAANSLWEKRGSTITTIRN